MLTGKTWSTRGTTCPNVTLSTTNPIWIGLGLNLGLCGKRLEYNQLRDGMDVDLSGISIMDININIVSQYWTVLPVITLPSLIWQNVAVQNTESKNFHPYCSDDFRVLDILLWSIVLTVKRGKCWSCVMLLTGVERRPWRSGFISKYQKKKIKAWYS
jgi:hypothetical protein